VRTVRSEGHAFHLDQHAEQLGDQVDGKDAPARVGGGVVHGFSFGSSDGGMAGSTTLCAGMVSRMLVGEGGWRPAWPRLLIKISGRTNFKNMSLAFGIFDVLHCETAASLTSQREATADVPPKASMIWSGERRFSIPRF
jgi:hypothetical protein